MCEKEEQTCICPLKGIIDLISKKWALLIINALGNCGKLRFNKIMETLSGISPKTLSDTLKELQAEGLINRESFAEIPPRGNDPFQTDLKIPFIIVIRFPRKFYIARWFRRY